jgi:hypothetical protein
MALSKLCFINTGSGADSTTSEEVDAIVDELARHPRVVLHFHGGLVNKQAGLEGAERLKGDCYDLVPAHPVFFSRLPDPRLASDQKRRRSLLAAPFVQVSKEPFPAGEVSALFH